jgi:DNA polymerase/3'-5' exonuclease PolX
MNYAAAMEVAERTRAALAPYCQRIAIAGSVRRQRPQVKDIEICAILLQEPSDLFGETLVAHHGFCAVVNQWRAIKGQPTGKYTQRRLPEGITLDLFMADADN